MHYRADQIIGNVYQGPKPPTGERLRAAGIEVLVLCAKEIIAEFQATGAQFPGVHVIYAPSIDADDAPPPEHWKRGWIAAAKEAAQRAQAGQKVLITCYAGLNRSGVVSALTTHYLTGFDGARCARIVQMSRQGALSNHQFVAWLNTIPAREIGK